jgi:hypothetical protein
MEIPGIPGLVMRVCTELGLTPRIDRLSGIIAVTVPGDQPGRELALVLCPMSNGVQVRALGLAGTGGQHGRFEPHLAVIAALAAYDFDLQLGVDRRDGEVEARLSVELLAVEAALQAPALTRALRDFVTRVATVDAILATARQRAADTAAPFPAFPPDLPISA